MRESEFMGIAAPICAGTVTADTMQPLRALVEAHAERPGTYLVSYWHNLSCLRMLGTKKRPHRQRQILGEFEAMMSRFEECTGLAVTQLRSTLEGIRPGQRLHASVPVQHPFPALVRESLRGFNSSWAITGYGPAHEIAFRIASGTLVTKALGRRSMPDISMAMSAAGAGAVQKRLEQDFMMHLAEIWTGVTDFTLRMFVREPLDDTEQERSADAARHLAQLAICAKSRV